MPFSILIVILKRKKSMILSKNNCVNTWATTMSKNTYH
jgi:hypothetical protein